MNKFKMAKKGQAKHYVIEKEREAYSAIYKYIYIYIYIYMYNIYIYIYIYIPLSNRSILRSTETKETEK